MNVRHVKKVLAAVLAAALLVPAPVPAKAETLHDTVIDDAEVTLDEELFKIQYEPQAHWIAEENYPNLFYNGTDYYSVSGESGTDDYFTVRFIGSGIDLYGSKNTAHANYDVYIDNEKAGEALAHLESGSTQHKQLLFSVSDLEDGEHVMKVVKQTETNTLAMQLDYLVVHHYDIPAESIILGKSEVTLESGTTEQVTAQVSPWVAANDTIVWSSADETVASVDQSGVITAVSTKTAETTVTATVEGSEVYAEIKVYVIPKIEVLSAFVGSTDTLDTQEDYSSLTTVFTRSWSDTGWKGDELLSKVGVVSREEAVHNVTVTASAFSTKTGDVIEASAVEIKWLKETLANIGRGNTSAPVKSFPDIIHKGGAVDLEPETVRFAWITINIPRSAKAGTYEGTVTVSADELETPYIFDYQFEVLDLVQPETGMEIQLWQHPFSVANYYGLAQDKWFTEEHFKYMRASMKEYKSIGGRDVVANIVEEAWNHQSYYSDPSMVKWTKKADGSFVFDYTWYDAWVNFQIECGVLDPENGIGQIKCYSIVPWNNQIAYYDESSASEVKESYSPGSDAWKEIWTEFLTDFIAHSKEKGWFDITYISMDERDLNQLQPAVELIESLQDDKGQSLKISSALNYAAPQYYDFTDRIQDISINLGNISSAETVNALAEHRAEKNLTTTLYTCTGDYPSNFTISEPADNMWLMWYSMTLGMDGYMRWAWDNWVQDPLTNVTYKYWEPGDGWFIYPSEKNSDENADYFYSTPRYEMMKKGIRDVNKAKYLLEQSESIGERIQKLTASIKRPSKGNNGYGSAVPANDAARQLTIDEANRMRKEVLSLSRDYLNAGGVIDPTPDDPSREGLEAAVAEAKALDENVYTEESWGKLSEALKAAEELASDASQEAIDAAETAVRKAIEGLERKPQEVQLPYEDVKKDEWYYKDVENVYLKKLMTGLNATTFGPGLNLARAQFAVILHRMNGETPMPYAAIFPDIPEGIWYTDAVLWANSIKVVTGYTNTGNFGPDDNITREQMAVMMFRYAEHNKYDTSKREDFASYTDADKVSKFAQTAMQWAVGNGIITGKNNKTQLDPQGYASRAECAAIITRFVKQYEEQ